VIDIPAELLLVNMNVWHFWQYWGPAITVGNATLPFTEIFWTGMLIGMGLLLLQQDYKGRAQFAVSMSRKPLARRLHVGEKGMVLVLLTAVYAAYLSSFAVIRVLKLAHNLENQWPATAAKVYDPHSDARSAGIPGPYFEGVGNWYIR
jgi:hypothetical protein